MLRSVLDFLRRRYFVVQAISLSIWLILEIAGYGFGIVHGMFRARLTDADSNPVARFIGMAPPPGPVRLSSSERSAVQQRIDAAFAGGPPRHVALSELRYMYALAPNSLCDWRGATVASDPKECNLLTDAAPLFRALLSSMHPRTEALMLNEKREYKGGTVTAAFFVGTSGKPKILLDFSRIRGDLWAKDKGFALKVYHPGGLTEIELGKELISGSAVYLIDDPGRLERRRGMCGQPTCPSQLLLYAFDLKEARERNLVNFDIDPDLEKRFDLYAALMNTGASPPRSLPAEPYKVESFEVTKFNTVKLDKSVDAVFGDGARNRVLYAPKGYHVAFGTVYAVKIDGRYSSIWDGGHSFPSLGTDRFVFDLVEAGKPRRLADVKCDGVVCFLPTSALDGSALRLEVRKFTQQSGEPWSDFAEFAALFQPLRRAQ